MKKSLGMKEVEMFESVCCKCSEAFDFSKGVEKSATLSFNFGFYDIGMDGFDQEIELCGHCAQKVFLGVHKVLKPEAKKRYFDYRDGWWWKRGNFEGILLISEDVEEIA